MTSSVALEKSSLAGARYVMDLCARLAACTDVPGTITRLFLSPATRAVHGLLRAEMEMAGLEVRVDAVGNMRGFYAGAQADAPVLLIGSHIDTVPDAGAYDGILGVAIPLALLRLLAGRRFEFAVELIAFSEEEGIRFQRPFLASRALLGQLSSADFALQDAEGVTFSQALRNFGLDPDKVAGDLLTPNTFAFLEVHIEQGPVLESLALPLGIVTSIVGQSRFELTFRGQANHAGTTPMPLRRDALAAAAEWIGLVERTGQDTPGLVATVGSLRALPGAANVIAGSTTATLDVRHGWDEIRRSAVDALLGGAQTLADRRGLLLQMRETNQQHAVAMNAVLRQNLADAASSCGYEAHAMTSGAGHDAMILASRLPAAMLFVRSPGGVSHDPSESVLIEDVEAALSVCLRLLDQLEPARVGEASL